MTVGYYIEGTYTYMYLVKDIAKAFWHESYVGTFSPDQQVKAYIQNLSLLDILLNTWKPML